LKTDGVAAGHCPAGQTPIGLKKHANKILVKNK